MVEKESYSLSGRAYRLSADLLSAELMSISWSPKYVLILCPRRHKNFDRMVRLLTDTPVAWSKFSFVNYTFGGAAIVDHESSSDPSNGGSARYSILTVYTVSFTALIMGEATRYVQLACCANVVKSLLDQ